MKSGCTARTALMTSVQYSVAGGSPARSPQVGEHVVHHQHRHVAAHAVGLLGDVHQGVVQRARTRRERVQLGDVGPRWEVRVATAGAITAAPPRGSRRVAARSSACLARSGRGDRRAIGDRVPRGSARSRRGGRDRVPRPARATARPSRPPNRCVDDVVADAICRADDVGVGQIGERTRNEASCSGRRAPGARRQGCAPRHPSARPRRPRPVSPRPTRGPTPWPTLPVPARCRHRAATLQCSARRSPARRQAAHGEDSR